eukprot:TRINITY_DN1633_c0_g1_i5.p1 TRINITY_DN1633_c0_g1~~TRINITY_DN1633_c0_g1_i5.p1  ORF type:complete len:100 (+),score=14.61 TRINITY_DN1633_c0_g1_i5:544-843(+)
MDEKCLAMWINVVLNEGFTLDVHTVKSLTLVSHYFANTLKNFIEHNYWFDLRGGRRLTRYSPLNQKNLRRIPEILPSAKKIVFHSDFKPFDDLPPVQLE